MKRSLLTVSIAVPVSLIIGMSCSLEAPAPPPATGGTGGAAGAGTGGSTTGSGGAAGTGGAAGAGTGGATTGTGGSTGGAAGATTGTGGATTGTGGATTGTGGATTGTGGAAGSGGATTGTGGATTGTGGAAGTGGTTTGTGGAAGAAGATTGTGGAAGTGGTTTGTGGAAGSGGQGGGGAGSDAGSADASTGDGGNMISVVGAFDGYLFTSPCNGGETGYDCLNGGCSGTTKTYTQTFPIGGVTGTVYNVTFAVNGITEAKLYSGGTRRPGTTPLARDNTGGDAWYQGGTVPNSTYNSYELHVTPAVTGAPNDYYLNAAATSSEEDHLSFVLNYTATIKVPAGGTITFRTYDSNCRQIMNCGNFTASCPMPRTLPATSWAPPPPTTFMQPFNGQFLHIDVTSVTTQ